MIAIIVKGLIEAGGFGEMWQRVNDGKRIEFLE